MNIHELLEMKTITNDVVEKTCEVAKFIEEVCETHGIQQINSDYIIRSYSNQFYNYSDLSLCISNEYQHEFVTLSTTHISASRETRLRNGDFALQYTAPTYDDIQKFIEDLPEIFECLKAKITKHTGVLEDVYSAIIKSKVE